MVGHRCQVSRPWAHQLALITLTIPIHILWPCCLYLLTQQLYLNSISKPSCGRALDGYLPCQSWYWLDIWVWSWMCLLFADLSLDGWPALFTVTGTLFLIRCYGTANLADEDVVLPCVTTDSQLTFPCTTAISCCSSTVISGKAQRPELKQLLDELVEDV